MIPFSKQSMVGQELGYMLRSCRYKTDFVTKCEKLLEYILDKKVLLTNSCTSALEIAGILLGIKSGDEVIVPAFTHPATASAFARLGARIVFADIREKDLNINPSLAFDDLVTSKTKAIVPVHYNGVNCMVGHLEVIRSSRNGIRVIEDNAHGLFWLNSPWHLSATSFHATKNYQCFEGGALFLNHDHDIDLAKCIRNNGTDHHLMQEGKVDAYTWVSDGSSYMPAELLAAYLYAQLEQREVIAARRKELWNYYYDNLAFIPLPELLPSSHHIFYFLADNKTERDRILGVLNVAGIMAVFHYQPLNKSKMGLSFGEQSCPVAEDVADRIIRLPLYYDLTRGEQDYIIEVLWKV